MAFRTIALGFLALAGCSAQEREPHNEIASKATAADSSNAWDVGPLSHYATEIPTQNEHSGEEEGPLLTDSSGKSWSVAINKNGAILRSTAGTLYLGETCDAYSPEYGRGSWEWANGGFVANLKEANIGFPRQEIDADHDGNCRLR